jgi:Flp pilus assembly pilin Flp
MKEILTRFMKRSDGAVTVDFVVLAAAIVALAAGVLFVILENAPVLAQGMGDTIEGEVDSLWD